MSLFAWMKRLAGNESGTAAIETAICVPLLLTMALGSFEVGMIVAKQQELQSGANEVQAVILAAAAGEGTNSDELEAVLQDSLGDTVEITLEAKYRCGTADLLIDAPECDNEDDQIYEFVRITLADSYVPVWTTFGVGNTLNYSVQRTVQVS